MPEYNAPKRKKPSATPSKPRPAPQPRRSPEKPAPAAPKRTSPRKPAKSAKQRHKQNMAIYYVMFMLVIVLVFSILSVTVLFNLEEVIAEGESIYTHEQIIEAAGVKTGVNLLRFDSSECAARIIDALVYIDSVQIKKNLPSKLTIQVVGAEEMANIAYAGSRYIISKNGRILGQAAPNSKNIVVLGYEADEMIVGAYISPEGNRRAELIFDIMEQIEETGLTGIVDIDLRDYLDIKMNYMDRIVLHIGHGTDLKLKLQVAVELLNNEIDSTERGTLRLVDPLTAPFIPDD